MVLWSPADIGPQLIVRIGQPPWNDRVSRRRKSRGGRNRVARPPGESLIPEAVAVNMVMAAVTVIISPRRTDCPLGWSGKTDRATRRFAVSVHMRMGGASMVVDMHRGPRAENDRTPNTTRQPEDRKERAQHGCRNAKRASPHEPNPSRR